MSTTGIIPTPATLDAFVAALFDGCEGAVCIAKPYGQHPKVSFPCESWVRGGNYGPSPYVCISTVKPEPGSNGLHRKQGNCIATVMVVLDDIGTKVPAARITVPHSYKLETSPGNFQLGYRLSPHASPVEAGALIDALASAGFTDKGAVSETRIVRVPGSINRKPGNNNFAARVVDWHPERVWTLDSLAQAFGVTPGVARAASQAAVGPKTPEEARAYEHTDEILAGLDRLGMVRWDDIQSGGYIGTACPWAAEHSFQDDRTGFNPELVHGNGFKCFHSHEKKSDHDVKEWLREKLGDDEWQRIEASAFVHRRKQLHDSMPFAVVDEPVCADIGAAPNRTTSIDEQIAEVLQNTPRAAPVIKHTWRDIGAGRKIVPLPPRPMITPSLMRGAVSQLFSPSNVGKSQAAIARAIAIAAERPDLVGDTEPYKRTGDVFLVNNEDPADEVERRRNAFMIEQGITDADMKHAVLVNETMGFKVAHKPDRDVVLTPEMKALGDEIKRRRSEGHEVCAVFLDTQSSVMGLDENSNSDMGAAGTLLAAWSVEHNVAMMIVHHTTKDAARNGTVDMNATRGASAFSNSVRIIDQLVPLSATEEDKLDENERRRWVKLVNVKGAYRPIGGECWFRKTGVKIPTAPEGPPDENGVLPMQPHDEAAALIYQKHGPDLGAVDTKDDNVLLNALARICEADRKGKPLLATNGGPADRRASVVLGRDTGGDSKDGQAILKALVRRGWAARGMRPGYRGNEVEVWLPTDEGAHAHEANVAEIEGRTAGALAEEPAPSEPRADDTSPADASSPGAGAFDGLEITFG